tara:strand:+ start:2885 stop:3589 length:705 start_codon:yes stop_codon:yes gene_type:complete
MANNPYRAMIAGLASMAPVTLRGQEYSGPYLATLVAIDPEQPMHEAAETPRIISELGRLVAAAYYDKEMAEVEYRVWREKTIHKYGNNTKAAKRAKFSCLVNPGLDAKGNEKPTKMPSRTEVDGYMRTLPEYRELYAAKLAAEETWATLHAALDAAKARTWAIKGWDSSQGADTSNRRRVSYDEPDEATTRHPGHSDPDRPSVPDTESQAMSRPRTPIPPPPSSGGPPPPPRRS